MANSSPGKETTRQSLERLWDTRLQDARNRYMEAALKFHRELFGTGKPIEPDAAESSRLAEVEAFADYCRVLATFTELVEAVEPPADEDSNPRPVPRGVK